MKAKTVWQILLVDHNNNNNLITTTDLYETKELAEQQGAVYTLGNMTPAYHPLTLWGEEPKEVPSKVVGTTRERINRILHIEGFSETEIVALADVFHNGLWGTADFDFCTDTPTSFTYGGVGAVVNDAKFNYSPLLVKEAFRRIGKTSPVIDLVDNYWSDDQNPQDLVFINEVFAKWDDIKEWAQEVFEGLEKPKE